MHDLAIRNGVMASGAAAEIAVQDGAIVAVAAEVGDARENIDAHGLTIFPGLIDVHLHFNEPGRTEWEGAATGSRALAAGGGTLYFDMPLNSTPCTVSLPAFEQKRTALAACSLTDFGLWGGIVPGNRDELHALAEAGVIGFKAFLCNSGLPEFPRADDLTLFEAMQVATRYDLAVAVHAESEEITAGLTGRIRGVGGKDVHAYLASRPVIAEVEAISRAALLAREAGARLHIVHISSGRGVAAALEARARGTRITIETCPHYLFFTDEDMERIGAFAKCSPPLRPASDRDELWRHVLAGDVDVIASDHSPSTPDLKCDPDFFAIWGGIAGVQSTLALLLDRGRGLPLSRIVSMLAETPAERFRIAGKGKIAPGYDADLALVDLTAEYALRPEDLHQRHAISPYLGARFRGRVERTLLRGRTIFEHGRFEHGRFAAAASGKWVRPTRQESSCTS